MKINLFYDYSFNYYSTLALKMKIIERNKWSSIVFWRRLVSEVSGSGNPQSVFHDEFVVLGFGGDCEAKIKNTILKWCPWKNLFEKSIRDTYNDPWQIQWIWSTNHLTWRCKQVNHIIQWLSCFMRISKWLDTWQYQVIPCASDDIHKHLHWLLINSFQRLE